MLTGTLSLNVRSILHSEYRLVLLIQSFCLHLTVCRWCIFGFQGWNAIHVFLRLLMYGQNFFDLSTREFSKIPVTYSSWDFFILFFTAFSEFCQSLSSFVLFALFLDLILFLIILLMVLIIHGTCCQEDNFFCGMCFSIALKMACFSMFPFSSTPFFKGSDSENESLKSSSQFFNPDLFTICLKAIFFHAEQIFSRAYKDSSSIGLSVPVVPKDFIIIRKIFTCVVISIHIMTLVPTIKSGSCC